ncbi:MAG: hypothetical protein JSS72_00970 [Armatimonadetes bacterium]|nr:hypothetical protein [Armatimonadota bacterium]
MTDSTWLAKLTGDSLTLQCLQGMFSDQELLLKNESGDWFLQAKEFQDCRDSGEVYETARELLVLLNGVAALYCNAGPIGLCSVRMKHVDGHLSSTVFGQIRARMGVQVFLKATVIGADGQEILEPVHASRAIMRAASQDVRIHKLLEYLSQESQNYASLYKIYELICGGFATVEAFHKWVTERNLSSVSDLRRFAETANNFYLAGDEARHANIDKIPSGNPGMSVAESKEIIFGIARAWLEYVSPSLQNT